MKNTSRDVELVRRFVEGVSELAFGGIVERYAALVYSTALRITSNNCAAEDIAQDVFLQLLQKSARVRQLLNSEPRDAGPAIVAGWLHRATRYEALEFLRSEARRKAREKVAMEDSLNVSGGDAGWQTIKPTIDEALDGLNEQDRRAILLRYFQEADFKAIGSALGVSNDTAQKRLSRALDRLREHFIEKGIATTAAALSTCLAQEGAAAAPTGLAQIVAREAWRAGGAVPKPTSPPRFQFPSPAKMAILGGVLFVLTALFWFAVSTYQPSPHAANSGSVSDPTTVASAPSVRAADSAAQPNGSVPGASAIQLGLRIVDETNGNPVATVQVLATTLGETTKALAPLHTDDDGFAPIEYPPDTGTLRIHISKEGYADMQLSWSPKQGMQIPAEYTVKMRHGVLIGGFAWDVSGKPVSDALVQLHLRNGPPDGPPPDRIGDVEAFVAQLNINTDQNGFWQTARVAEELLPRIDGNVWKPGYLPHGWTRFGTNEGDLDKLFARQFVFIMDRGLEFRGTVTDVHGQPAQGVYITLGDYFSNQATATSDASGAFLLGGCVAGRHILTALKQNVGVAYRVIDVTTNTPPVSFRLEAFRTLRLVVVDPAGQPIPAVRVRWENFGENGKTINDFPGTPTPQLAYEGTTGAGGTLTWDQAPAEFCTFSFYAKSHKQLHNVRLRADGLLQTVTLEEMLPPQIVRGTVRDAITGQSISPFRVRQGYPRTSNGMVEQVWSQNSSSASDFGGGEFELIFTNDANEDPTLFKRIFGVSADGYEDGISRVVSGEEGSVVLEFWLKPKSQASTATR